MKAVFMPIDSVDFPLRFNWHISILHIQKIINMKRILISGIVFLLLTVVGKAEKIEMSKVPERGFYSTRSAKQWEESLVSGNGTMGVMVEGNPYHESIVFNHALLYLPIHKPIKPVSQGKHLQEIRQMMLDGKYTEASQFVVDLANSEGYTGKHATDPFIPAFRMNIVSDSSEIKDYTRTVDFTTGEIEVKWNDKKGVFSRQVFISRPDNVVVIRLRSNGSKLIHTTLDLSQVTTHDEGRLKKFMMNENFNISKIESTAIDNELCFRVWYEKPWDGSFKGYEGVVKVVRADGKVKVVQNKLIIDGATEVLLLARVEPSSNMDKSMIGDMQNALSALPADYEKLLQPHRKIHKELFERVSLDLNATATDRRKSSEELLASGGGNPALIEKLFDAARYNVLCATGINPPNLQGIWGATMTAPWSGDYTTNGNLPVVISHYLQASTPELMLPLFNRLEAYMDEFKVNARELYNCRGIHVPSRFSTHGLNNHFDATWPMTFWTVGAAWYSLFYYDYYLYTLDKDFLRNRALPFMEQAALFYEDFLVEGEDGKYIFNPSYSPENHPKNSQSQACINATMEIMGANGLLRTVIEASQILGVNQDKIPVWKSMLAKIPPYELNKDGEIREWMWDDLQDNHNHRHASQLFGLYDLHDPLIMNNDSLRTGCKKNIDKRMEIRRKDNGGIMAFGMVQLAFASSALGETETTYDMLKWLGNSYWNNNMVSTHDPKKTFNVDICGGYPSLIMKMLVYSEPGLISLLPCIPQEWSKGSIKGIALRGGILMEELNWNGQNVQVVLSSKINQTAKLKLKGNQVKEIKLEAGKQMKLSF